MRALWIVLASALILLLSKRAAAQSTNEMSAANNPLQPSLGINLQDQYAGRYYGLDNNVDSNAFLLRGTRLLITTSDMRHTDAGDLNLFDLFLLKTGSIELGIGPQHAGDHLIIATSGREDAGKLKNLRSR